MKPKNLVGNVLFIKIHSRIKLSTIIFKIHQYLYIINVLRFYSLKLLVSMLYPACENLYHRIVTVPVALSIFISVVCYSQLL